MIFARLASIIQCVERDQEIDMEFKICVAAHPDLLVSSIIFILS